MFHLKALVLGIGILSLVGVVIGLLIGFLNIVGSGGGLLLAFLLIAWAIGLVILTPYEDAKRG